jgi:hypothetical protein
MGRLSIFLNYLKIFRMLYIKDRGSTFEPLILVYLYLYST